MDIRIDDKYHTPLTFIISVQDILIFHLPNFHWLISVHHLFEYNYKFFFEINDIGLYEITELLKMRKVEPKKI